MFQSVRLTLVSCLSQFKFHNSRLFHYKFIRNAADLAREQKDKHFYDVDYDSITNGDSELLSKLKVIMLEVDVLRQSGKQMPDKMTTQRWIDLLSISTQNQRMKQLQFWWLNEKKRENDKAKKELKKRLRSEKTVESPKSINTDQIEYGFGKSTIFLRIYDSTMDKHRNWKLMRAMMFNPTVIFDCGYESHMSIPESQNCAKQLLCAFAENRGHDDPLNLYFCNAPRENRVISKLHKYLPTLYDDDFPINITEKSYLEMFPKEKLVYLTPHCRQELKEYDDDDIYIIGALVDKSEQLPLSLGKAKSEGLRMAKFPLDRYLDWTKGSKTLPVNQVLNILLDLRKTGDWEKAFTHIPKRKLQE